MAHQRTVNPSPPSFPVEAAVQSKLWQNLSSHVKLLKILTVPPPPFVFCNSQPDACCINTDGAVLGTVTRVPWYGMHVRAERRISREICSRIQQSSERTAAYYTVH